MDPRPVRVIGTRASSEEEDRLQRLRVLLQQTGGDPSSILDLLATIVRRADWRKLDDGKGGTMSFLAYFRDLGWSRDDLKNFIQHSRHRYEQPPKVKAEVRNEMTWLRGQVDLIINPKAEPPGAPVGNANALKIADESQEEIKGDNIPFDLPESQRGTSRDHALRRLQRDAPELAEEVIRGEMSAHRAAIKAGFRQETIAVPKGDPRRAARIIVKHLDPAAVKQLIVELSHAAGFTIETD